MWLHVQGPFSQVDEPMNSPSLALLTLDEIVCPLHCFIDIGAPKSRGVTPYEMLSVLMWDFSGDG